MTTFMLPLSLVFRMGVCAECDNMQNDCHYHLTVGVHAECDRSQHSCCHHVLFYSEYVIMLNVPGHAVHGVIISRFIVDVWA